MEIAVTLNETVNAGFPLGILVSTPSALRQVSQEDALRALGRHVLGDWGDVPIEDKRANDRAVLTGERLLSAYITKSGIRFWIITEANRSATTILLPEDY